MECPVCKQERYSRDWKRSQWNTSSPLTFQFNCCKQCNADGYFVASDELIRCLEHIETYMAALHSSGIQWIPLFNKWMEMRHDVRKQLSYRGGIRLRHGDKPLHPRADHEATRNDPRWSWADYYIDPGNFVYGLAMRMMWPQFVKSGNVEYNDETLGDILEGILGLGYEYSETWTKASKEAYLCLDSFVYWVYRFACAAKNSIWQCKSFEDVKLVACAGSDPTRYV